MFGNLLRFLGDEDAVRLDLADPPEFDHWRWIDYWRPAREVIRFKRQVYRQALAEFERLLDSKGFRTQRFFKI